MNKFNERAWAGQLIAWIQESISKGTTVFQHASNDEGIKVASGRTKFPDILLFTDKISGIVFNGWELKFPDTPADDIEMLENALEKAERLKSNSFVTWNGSEAIIWQINEGKYTVENLIRLKTYHKEKGIESRNDLSDPGNYRKHEPKLKQRLVEILHDLQQLFRSGELKEAINISDEMISAIKEGAKLLIPQFKEQINQKKAENHDFRKAFNLWKINESSTLKILASSSRRVEVVEPEDVLARYTYYKFIGKIVFYLTLAENLSGKVSTLQLTEPQGAKTQLNSFFSQAQKIDYQAVFEKDFTDEIEFNPAIDKLIFRLVEVFNAFDFKILPSGVIGNILENLVPSEEKQKFGQYFTQEPLTLLVAFSAIKNRNFVVMDPTSGTGTFLNSFYQILAFLGQKDHRQLLSQIWGNDISHFPAVLSVINLYKQKLDDTGNFPRVTRKNFFNLSPDQTIKIPDGDNNPVDVKIPLFDAVVSNFPFIRQEDIPKDILPDFKKLLESVRNGLEKDNHVSINERSDFYVYCIGNSLKFIKPGGFLAAITSNAWLGKNYGSPFKKFLLDNFSIQYVFKSNAEHWFKNSQVSTIFITLKKSPSEQPTRFVTLNFKLSEILGGDINQNIQFIEDLYTQIDDCDNPANQGWRQDDQYQTVFSNSDDSVRVSLVARHRLLQSLDNQENWAKYFIAENPLSIFESKLISPQGSVFTNGRGTRTGQDEMHILTSKDIEKLKIEANFLLPVLQSSRHISTILHIRTPDTFLFVCDKAEHELEKKFPNAYKWVKNWEMQKNKTGIQLSTVFHKRKPFWYTLKAEQPANIFISINPDKKLFFSYSPNPIYLNQRLVAIRTKIEDAPIITALLNSIVSLLIVELNGVSRNLGALDLNADFFKTKMKMLNPALLTPKDIDSILAKFAPLSMREMERYDSEFIRKDRVEFDTAILKAFGYEPKILSQLYALLIETIENRVELKNR